MQKVARLLGRTEGSFQRVCRGLGILRWPYRVRKSLQEIMAKTREYLVRNPSLIDKFLVRLKITSDREQAIIISLFKSCFGKTRRCPPKESR